MTAKKAADPGDLTVTLDPSTVITAVSPNVATSLGFETHEMVGARFDDYLHPGDREIAGRFLAGLSSSGERRAGLECRLARANGHYLWHTFSAARSTGNYLLVGHDLTGTKALETQMIMSDRLASLGTIAAGVAHEINNPLAYVLSNLSFLAEQLADLATTNPELAPAIAELERAAVDAIDGAQRVRSIVADLRAFSRTDEQSPLPVDVAETLEIAVRMTQHEIRHRAHLIRQYAPVPTVVADNARLGQVFVNLLLNAAQALAGSTPESSQIRLRVLAPEPRWVHIEVIDNGPGIPVELQSRIFDPFFTTKPQGVGTGLGLSVCHGIVTSLGGRIELESTVGKGTLVRVMLPAADYAPHKP